MKTPRGSTCVRMICKASGVTSFVSGNFTFGTKQFKTGQLLGQLKGDAGSQRFDPHAFARRMKIIDAPRTDYCGGALADQAGLPARIAAVQMSDGGDKVDFLRKFIGV